MSESQGEKRLKFIGGELALFLELGVKHGEVEIDGEVEHRGVVLTAKNMNAAVGYYAYKFDLDITGEGVAFLMGACDGMLPDYAAIFKRVRDHYTDNVDLGGYSFVVCAHCSAHGKIVCGDNISFNLVDLLGGLSTLNSYVDEGLISPLQAIKLLQQMQEAGLPIEGRQMAVVFTMGEILDNPSRDQEPAEE